VGCVGTGTCLGVVEKRKILATAEILTPALMSPID